MNADMITASRERNALGAINAALVQLRDLARGGVSGSELAELLDALEYLPRLMAEADDRTSEFGAVLRDLVGRRVELGLALARFETDDDERW